MVYVFSNAKNDGSFLNSGTKVASVPVKLSENAFLRTEMNREGVG